MVIPSSTPGFFGSFTWNVPELGMTDSVQKDGDISAVEMFNLLWNTSEEE